ncbi:hypothetical protein CEXT_589561 [Caerostris extrusa]|uniref:Uncharacterized protein n=1 Tax=Caerostris extrusa TaxID=172846 RepID=A0AAV4QFC5_CAEEX|nr:hypothetical protein CEXT_589561 [Caerostris extrusa]
MSPVIMSLPNKPTNNRPIDVFLTMKKKEDRRARIVLLLMTLRVFCHQNSHQSSDEWPPNDRGLPSGVLLYQGAPEDDAPIDVAVVHRDDDANRVTNIHQAPTVCLIWKFT